MKLYLFLAASFAVFLIGCSSQKTVSESPSPSTTVSVSATPDATSSPNSVPVSIVESNPDELQAGQEVTLFWRERAIADMESLKPYEKKTNLSATDGPGRISGKLIVEKLTKEGVTKSSEWRLISVSPGDEPSQSWSGITVDEGENEFFDNYLCRTEDGEWRLYLEIEPAQ